MLPTSFLMETALKRRTFAAAPATAPQYSFTERATAAAAFGRISVPSPRENIYIPAGKEKNWVESFAKDLAAVSCLGPTKPPFRGPHRGRSCRPSEGQGRPRQLPRGLPAAASAAAGR